MWTLPAILASASPLNQTPGMACESRDESVTQSPRPGPRSQSGTPTVARSAAANPTAPATLLVPDRIPRSCPPPSIRGTSETSPRTTSAPAPFGPPSLWAETEIRSASAASAATSTHAAACTASVCTTACGARARTMRTTSASGWTVPTSLFTSITETTTVRSSISDAERVEIDDPTRRDRCLGDPEPLASEPSRGREHRLVLERRDHDPVAVAVLASRSRCTLHRQVVGLGPAGGEDDLSRLGAQIRGDRLARRLQGRLGGPGDRVPA